MRRLALATSLVLLAAPLAAQEPPPVNELAAADNAFACDLYQALRRRESGNLFYSPYSISSALAMTFAGARGDTAAEMAKTLRIDSLRDRVHELTGELDAELARREKTRVEEGSDPFRLRVANALWGQIGYEFRQEYLDLLARRYGAALRPLDFRADPEASRRAINAWVEDRTEDRIRDLLQPGQVSPDMRLVLTNAIYFKASWLEEFQDRATRDGAFHRLDGTEVRVPTMHRTAHFPYLAGDGFQAIELPYAGEEVALLVCVPDAGRLDAFEATLTGERLAGIARGLGFRFVSLGLPRFEVRSRFELKDVLESLGMRKAFVFGQADFSGMNGNRELYVGAVIHQSFVKVDEKGTEAAAATAVMMRAGGRPPQPIALEIDRPFLFFVRDRKTGAVLFMGRVLDPTAKGGE